MKTSIKAIVAGAALAICAVGFAPGEANAGCLKGAVVGGVAGHYAGHHGLLGAGVGCFIGSRSAHRQMYRDRTYTNRTYNNGYRSDMTGYGSSTAPAYTNGRTYYGNTYNTYRY
jgi:hypothetical protein